MSATDKSALSYRFDILGFLAALIAVVSACTPSAPPVEMEKKSCTISPDHIGAFVDIPAGSFIKGASPFYSEESPSVRLQVNGFSMQIHEVTNAQFAAFVEDTEYLTDAERSIIENRDGAGSALFQYPDESQPAVQPGWSLTEDAIWRSPGGKGSTLVGRANEPVVHVSRRDAKAYASWAGGRLPSEVEWEYAASLGLPDPEVQSSGAYGEDGPRANTWQGIFPIADLGSDGFKGAAPVGCFEADELGLYDMIGNVWEWTDTPYGNGTHTIKGGSFLCAENYCQRYRPAARQPQESDFSSNHIGFRIVKDVSANSALAD